MLGTFAIRQDPDSDFSLRSTSENYLCCKSCAEVVFARKGNFCYCFEDGGFTGGLVSTDDDLGKRNEFTDAIGAKLVDFVEEMKLLERLERVEDRAGSN